MRADTTTRNLRLDSVSQLLAELDRLEAQGYERLGKWTLGEMCDHLSYYVKGSLEGFGFTLPWLVRVLVGPPMKRKLLRGELKPGSRTIPDSVPKPGVDEREAVARLKTWLERFESPEAVVHPSPLLGELSKEEWRALHLGHAAHHLSFLIPGDG